MPYMMLTGRSGMLLPVPDRSSKEIDGPWMVYVTHHNPAQGGRPRTNMNNICAGRAGLSEVKQICLYS